MSENLILNQEVKAPQTISPLFNDLDGRQQGSYTCSWDVHFNIVACQQKQTTMLRL